MSRGPSYPYSEHGAWLMHCQIQEAYARDDNAAAWEIEALWDEIEQARHAADEAATSEPNPVSRAAEREDTSAREGAGS